MSVNTLTRLQPDSDLTFAALLEILFAPDHAVLRAFCDGTVPPTRTLQLRPCTSWCAMVMPVVCTAVSLAAVDVRHARRVLELIVKVLAASHMWRPWFAHALDQQVALFIRGLACPQLS